MKRIGLALGGGGVRGLAHVLVLEALDEMGCKPCIISGTSMGAMIGALYASGLSGSDIKASIRQHIVAKNDTWRQALKKRHELLKWASAIVPEHRRGGLVKPDKFLHLLLNEIRTHTFEELNVPVLVTAADYWTAEEIVFDSGDLLPALKASMAVPGVFAPVEMGGRLLVDGSVVNLTPYGTIMGRCDIVIAVNVAGSRTRCHHETPDAWTSVLGACDIMQEAALAVRMRQRPPHVYVHPDICDVGVFDFRKVEDVFRQSEPAVRRMREDLAKQL